MLLIADNAYLHKLLVLNVPLLLRLSAMYRVR
jgi:hypothetical protein